MTWTDIVFERLKANCLEVVCHVPDSVLAPLITRAEADPFFTVVPLTREEEGIGVLTGAYLGGRRGLLMMQVSGLRKQRGRNKGDVRAERALKS